MSFKAHRIEVVNVSFKLLLINTCRKNNIRKTILEDRSSKEERMNTVLSTIACSYTQQKRRKMHRQVNLKSLVEELQGKLALRNRSRYRIIRKTEKVYLLVI